ncbi:MAG TPA: hypothetical protein VHC21_02180 [Candidatus Saccharimonadales bacterium]|nr:hypothetical protein [Candidatus Saccharimonadales bacterium]
MSEQVADGIIVKTHAGYAATAEGPFHCIDIYGDAVDPNIDNKPLHEATDAIYMITHDPALSHDPIMCSLRTYVENLDLVEEHPNGGQHGQPLQRFEPNPAAWGLFRHTYTEALRLAEPTIDFLGVRMGPAAFVATVNYVMTNTVVWAEEPGGKGEDPRFAMIEKFKSGN